MSYGIIYKATGPGGKVYIGQTVKTISRRKAQHKFMALKGFVRNAFQIALLESGFENFIWEQIDTAETPEELDQKEKAWIAHYKANDPAHGYNLTSGGKHVAHSEEFRRKMSEARKGKPNLRLVGHPVSEETRRKIGDANRGRSPWNKGEHLSAETRRKLSDAKKNPSSETRRRRSESLRGCNATITEETARQIKIDLANEMRVCDVAKRNGVPRHIVGGIKYGHNWAWLDVLGTC